MISMKKGGHYKRVIKDLSKIKISFLDCGAMTDADSEYFVCVNNFDSLVYPKYGTDIENLEKSTGTSISSFENYLEACEIRIGQFKTQSNVLKCGLAYLRSLDFERATRDEAEKGFNNLFESNYYIDRSEQVCHTSKSFQDYVFRYILELAQKHNMVVQVHTGLLEGNGNILVHSNPSCLNKLFFEYPNLRFDIFHIGYPFYSELGALCKMFPNVFIDMCWAHIVSPIACKRALSEWLEFLPYNKIIGFGGDYRFPDGVYSHQKMARQCICKVLSEKVSDGIITFNNATEISRALLFDNAAALLLEK